MYQCSEQIDFWAHVKPQDFAFIDENHEVTFAQLDSFTRKIAFSLNEKGFKQGQVVALILPNYLGWLFTLSLYRLGISTFSQNNLNLFSDQLKPDWVISLDAHPGVVSEQTLIIDDPYLAQLNTTSELAVLPGFASEDSIASFFSTSGTTGAIKYIATTAKELRGIATRVGTNDSFGSGPVLSRLMFGAAWAHFHALKCLNLGQTYYSCVFTDYRLAKFMSTHPISTLIGSPSQIAAFLDVQMQTATKLPLLKTIVMGGSVPSQEIIDRVKNQLDCTLYNTYGSTEAGHIAIYEVKDSQSQGFAVRPPVTLEIVDEAGQQVGPGVVGVVRYKRDDMAHEYFNNKEATAECFKDGYFYPGDLGSLDAKGLLTLNGRSNEVLNLGGAKINPETVDAIALAQLGVRDCAAFSVMGPAGVEQMVLALVTESDFSKEHFEKVLEKKSPCRIAAVIVLEEIPRNAGGKIERLLLSERHKDLLKPT